MTNHRIAAALTGCLATCACTEPVYEYLPAADSGNMTLEQAEKICRYEASLAYPYEPFSYDVAVRNGQFGLCIQAKGFQEGEIGDRNIFTGTVTPRSS
jgi:hypothetical protein